MDGQYLPDDEIDIDSLSSSEPPEFTPQMFAEGGGVASPDIEEDFFQNMEPVSPDIEENFFQNMEPVSPRNTLSMDKYKLALWAEKNNPDMLTANNNELAVLLMQSRRGTQTYDDRSEEEPARGERRSVGPFSFPEEFQNMPGDNVFGSRREMPRPEGFDYPRLEKGDDYRRPEQEKQKKRDEIRRQAMELGFPFRGTYYSQGGEVKERDIEYYTKGGEASIESQTEAMNQFLLADEEDAMPVAYATTPYGATQPTAPERSTKTAKLMLKQLSTKSGGGKSKRSKEMSLETGDLSPAIPELGAPQTEQEKLIQIATARSQYDALEQAYKLKAQAAQRAGKGLMRPTFNTVMFDQPTLEKPGPLMARTFAKGGEADALEGMQKRARENEVYRESEKYLNSRGQMPDIKISRFMRDIDNAAFTALNLPMGSGTIKVNKNILDEDYKKDIGPAALAHEITHAADRQMKQQAIEQRGKNTKFAEAYEKLVGSEGRNRTEPARRADYEWTEGNRSYRSTPEEIVAHGVGAFSGPMLQDRAPLHVDPTAATEFQILLDLAQRDIDKGPKGLERVPTFLRKFFKYADGGPVYRADGSPASGERLTPQQIEQLAADQAALNQYYAPKARPSTGMNRKRGPISQQLDTGEAYVNMAKGVTELPYDLLGAPRDISNMIMTPFGYGVKNPVMGSDFIKEQMTKRGVRPEPPADPTSKGFYTAGELLSNLTNPAGVSRKVGPVVEKGVKAVGKEAARQVERGIFNEGPLRGITPQPAFAVPPQGPAKTPAPASDLGFYSAAEQAALNLPRKEGSGAAFLNDLMKAPDVKKEELSAIGLDEFLKSKPKATRQEVQDFIANNRFDVKEVQLGGNVVEDPVGLAKRKEIFDKYEPGISALYKQMDAAPQDQPDLWNQLYGKATEIQRIRDREADAAYVIPEPVPTKFSQYQLPGGKNYREILLTIPSSDAIKISGRVVPTNETQADDILLAMSMKGMDDLNYGRLTDSTGREIIEFDNLDANSWKQVQAIVKDTGGNLQETKKTGAKESYKSPHFNEPNVLAHLRVNDRVDADGKKMLLIEELQSDWHQAGRDKGYKGDVPAVDYNDPAYVAARDRARELLNEFNANNTNRARQDQIYPLLEEAREAEQQFVRISNKRGEAVPDAPFKDTWHQLALKRALKYAADNGYDRVGLTTGKQQVRRYDLSKQVDNISYEPTEKGFYINVISKEGSNVLNGDYSAKELEGIVGKELTQKMLAKEGKNEFDPKVEPDLADVRTLDGIDLQVGGEGMKKYYDEIYPAFLAKQAKKYGAQMGETSIRTQTNAPAYVDYIVGRGNFTDTTVLGVRADGSTEIINQNPNSMQEAQQLANRYKEKHLGGGKEAVRYIDIVPGMQDAVPYAKGGSVDKNRAFIKAHT